MISFKIFDKNIPGLSLVLTIVLLAKKKRVHQLDSFSNESIDSLLQFVVV